MDNIIKVVKKVAFSFFSLYGYNLIAIQFNLLVPINIITVLLVSILGMPGLVLLILLKYLYF